MRSLTLKLNVSFLAVALTGALLVTGFAIWTTFREFDRYVFDQQQQEFIDEVTGYYRLYGTWDGVAEALKRDPLPPPPRNEGDEGTKTPPQPPPPDAGGVTPPRRFTLVDGDGHVLMAAGNYRMGQQVPEAEIRRGVEIEVDGEVMGTVIDAKVDPEREPVEIRYLMSTSRAFFAAAVGATIVALLLGFLLARTLTRPLRELTGASRAVARGELGLQVPVRSRDELGELAEAFNQMSADLARASEQRRRTTADIAHDLRTPLTVIAGYVESLRDGVLAPSPSRLDTIHKEVQHLQRLVEDLRTLSLADAGELHVNPRPVQPEDLLNRIAAAYAQHAERGKIDLRVDAAVPLPAIHADPERMVQVLGNLVGNALRYTPEGGSIVLAARPGRNFVELSVRDTGEGIPPDALPHVFDRFYRADDSRQVHEGESGLGLAIAKSIVELHGGSIDVVSTPGVGTTFTLALPTA